MVPRNSGMLEMRASIRVCNSSMRPSTRSIFSWSASFNARCRLRAGECRTKQAGLFAQLAGQDGQRHHVRGVGLVAHHDADAFDHAGAQFRHHIHHAVDHGPHVLARPGASRRVDGEVGVRARDRQGLADALNVGEFLGAVRAQRRAYRASNSASLASLRSRASRSEARRAGGTAGSRPARRSSGRARPRPAPWSATCNARR